MTNMEPPQEIIDAARSIALWADMNGHFEYEIHGICSRKHARKLEEERDTLAAEKEALKRHALDTEKRFLEIAGEASEAKDQCAEMNATFDLRHSADMRAIKRWQEATGRELVWPDHADLSVWLLEKIDSLEKTLFNAQQAIFTEGIERDRLQSEMQEAWKLVNAMAGQEYWDRAEEWLEKNVKYRPAGIQRC